MKSFDLAPDLPAPPLALFSGGEPTLQAALPAKMIVAGPAMLVAAVQPHLDWVGLDIKGPLHRHDAITGAPGSALRSRESLGHLLSSGVACECRTTWHPGLFDAHELLALADELAALGVTHWAVQECRTKGIAPFALTPAQTQALAARFSHFVLRRA